MLVVRHLPLGMALDANGQYTEQQIKYKRFGRPVGSRNYSGNSLIAREMKERGIRWVDEFISAYVLYKKQWSNQIEDPTLPPPNPDLLYFWQEVLPYITVKMIERETRGIRPKRKFKRKISTAALEALAKAEGRKIE